MMMATMDAVSQPPSTTVGLKAAWPFPVLLLAAGVAIGLARGSLPAEVLRQSAGAFGQAASGFLFILLPSFVLAALLGGGIRSRWGTAAVTGASPVCAAAMVCPDTAYSVLAHAAGERRLHMAFGSFAGFKLLVPAGPLIVATGLGVQPTAALLGASAFLALPVLATGWLWARAWRRLLSSQATELAQVRQRSSASLLAPMTVLFLALLAGFSPWASQPWAAAVGSVPAALSLAAVVALVLADPQRRAACLDAALARTSRLLFMIGAAAALGVQVAPLLEPGLLLAHAHHGAVSVMVLFAAAALVKTAQGSSMVTFATVTALLGPAIAPLGLSMSAAVLAICAGSLTILLPNDSFYWLVRTDALKDWPERRCIAVLAVGSVLQALTAVACLLAAVSLDWL